MLAKAAFPSFFLTLGGFILLLLVTLSVPIIKTIYLLHIETPGGSSLANLGVFGACARSFPHVSYDIDNRFLGIDLDDLGRFGDNTRVIMVKALTGSLVVNAIACGLAGISLFFALFAWLCSSRFMEIVTFLTLFLSSLGAWLAFFLDLALVLVTRSRINSYTNGAVIAHIGNALWMALAAAAALSVAICFAGCGMFGRYSDRHTSRDVAPIRTEKPARRWPWQKRTTAGTY